MHFLLGHRFTPICHRFLTAVCIVAGCGVPAAAQVEPPAPAEPNRMARDEATGRSTIRAIRLQEPLGFDGRLDEPIYEQYPGFGGMLQATPDYNEPSTERTEISVEEVLREEYRRWMLKPGEVEDWSDLEGGATADPPIDQKWAAS